MMDKTSYCNRRRIVLLEDTAKRLKSSKCRDVNSNDAVLTDLTGAWEFNVELS